MTTDTAIQIRQEWKSGWTLVFAATLGVVLGSVPIYTTGLFMQPLEAEFGWSRTEVSAGLTVSSVLGVLFSPLFGYLVDRWGSRRLAVPGSILFCLALAALSFAGPSIWSWWLLWFALGWTLLCLKPTVWSAAVSASFFHNRGIALAIMLCGTGIGSTTMPLIANALIDGLGWRDAYRVLGLGLILTVVPVLWFFFFDARHADPKARRNTNPVTPAQHAGWGVREGFRSRQFYILCLTALIVTGVIVGFVVHLVPMLGWYGLTRDTAVTIASMVGITSIIGRLTVGYLFDRLPGPPIGMVSFLLPLVTATLFLLFPGSLTIAIVAVIFLGLSVGGEYDAIIYLGSRYFGMRNFGTLFGFVAAGILAGVALGPLVAGMLFDMSQSYRLFLITVIPLSAFSALLIGTLGAYPDHKNDEARVS